MVFNFLLRLGSTILCFFFAFDFCDQCVSSRRIQLTVDGTGESGQIVQILAVCDQPGTDFINMDSANAPIRQLRDTSGSCVLEDTGIIDDGGVEFPVTRFNDELPISCDLQLGGPPVEIEFCCPEPDSVAVIMGAFETNSGLFELDALAQVSDEVPEFEERGFNCEASTGGVSCDSSSDLNSIFLLFRF